MASRISASKENGSADTLYFNAYTEDLFSWDNDLEERPRASAEDQPRLPFLRRARRAGDGRTASARYLNRYADFDFDIDYDEVGSQLFPRDSATERH